ncbi:hypothetical protein FB45DRAFT_178844 [Roridomyces roridus]|uniref:Fungal N-terminal domain-containing protein n=1 Tax=Roridomyces roridus TaxID=1738132 RepID=A0AAD7FW59_9AGAR|nr:hypothetical protein FB45DRAFT_178844 [Roridomyces roridus]
MDPITVTTTVITLATFIKDLIEVGQSIMDSIEKVSENRRQLRDLTNEICRSLANIANLVRGCEDEYMAPALLAALGELKAEMLHVLRVCQDSIIKQEDRGLQALKSQLKMWRMRNKMENKIWHLKEHVMSCYMKFIAYSTARNEQRTAKIDRTTDHVEEMAFTAVNATVRIEQTVVLNHTENQVRLQRIEGMMARVLCEEKFGQDIMNQTMDIISADTGHATLESQYLSVSVMHLIDHLRVAVVSGKLSPRKSKDIPSMGQPHFVLPTPSKNVLYDILRMTILCNNPAQFKLQWTDINFSLGVELGNLGSSSEAMSWYTLSRKK